MLKFDEIKVSTTTVIIQTNMAFHLDWVFDILPIYKLSKECSSIKEFHIEINRANPPIGAVTLVQFQEKSKGFPMKKTRSKYFRNALSLVMYVGKLVTLKIPAKGKIQLTGCTTDEHSKMCIQSLWNTISCYKPSLETYMLLGESNRRIVALIETVMTNKVFKLGFNINRQNLDQYMNTHTEFNSLLETSFGYTGVNIKIPFEVLPSDDAFCRLQFNMDTNNWKDERITFEEFRQLVSGKKKRYKNTFLVFHSGTAIMSGMSLRYMENVFNMFVAIISKARPFIEELG
jgi:hypothetical protein